MTRSGRQVPYYSQFASAELIGDIVARRMRVDEDPRWRDSGARDRAEYARWAKAGCGMACLQMILGAVGVAVPSLVELAKGCERYGGYRARGRDEDGYEGLFYAGFVAFVGAEFGLRSRVVAPLPLAELISTVSADEVVLASVHHGIRQPTVSPRLRGGHLVLVIDADQGGLCFHNPSGDTPDTQRAVTMDERCFAAFYAERGVAISLPRDRA